MNGLTLAQLRTITRQLVADNSATAKSWSDSQVNDAINMACLKYAELTQATYIETTVANDANGRLVMPTDFVRCVRVFSPGFGMLDLTDITSEDMRYPLWRTTTTTSSPTRYAAWDRKTLQTLPRYTNLSPAISYTVGYIQNPTEMSADSDTPDSRIITAHHHSLKFCAAWWLLQDDIDAGSKEQADLFMSQFIKLTGGTATTEELPWRL